MEGYFLYANAKSAALFGIDSYIVEVEVDIRNGMPVFDIVGLPDSAVRESRERVRAAMINNGFRFPDQRVTLNLAPADMRKEGAGFDLAITIAIMVANGQLLQSDIEEYIILGELSLAGKLRSLPGVISMAIAAKQAGFKHIMVPAVNGAEAALVEGINVFAAHSLYEVLAHLRGEALLSPTKKQSIKTAPAAFLTDFAEIQGQIRAKRALEVAVAGGHNVVFRGPPGAGKTMLARRVPTILPTTTLEEVLEVTKIYSVAGLHTKRGHFITERPFRMPHHTISPAGLLGGGLIPKPGEISLAHHGVLFLDELPEFSKAVLEGLRQPLEDGQIRISRAKNTIAYPAKFMLICSLNPCPCGFFGFEEHGRRCICTATQVRRYQSKLSGPLLDRIDLQLDVPRVDYHTLSSKRPNESSAVIRQRVTAAVIIQQQRSGKQNGQMEPAELKIHCQIDSAASQLLANSFDKLGLSARAYDKILKIARTIADLAGEEHIQQSHVAEAISYRAMDRK